MKSLRSGKFYKIADLSENDVACICQRNPLPSKKIGQEVTVSIDTRREGTNLIKEQLISPSAEFTPKVIIQTKEERASI
jgi:hypothetical protein